MSQLQLFNFSSIPNVINSQLCNLCNLPCPSSINIGLRLNTALSHLANCTISKGPIDPVVVIDGVMIMSTHGTLSWINQQQTDFNRLQEQFEISQNEGVLAQSQVNELTLSTEKLNKELTAIKKSFGEYKSLSLRQKCRIQELEELKNKLNEKVFDLEYSLSEIQNSTMTPEQNPQAQPLASAQDNNNIPTTTAATPSATKLTPEKKFSSEC